MTRIHGGRIFEASAKLNRGWFNIIDFSANINPFGQPARLKDVLFEAYDLTLHYPEERAQSFISGLSRYFDLEESYFLPGPGSTIHIYLLARLLGQGSNVIIGPAFSEYEAAIKAAGGQFVYVNAGPDNLFAVTMAMVETVFSHNPTAIFLANPANPTGRLIPEPVLEALLAESQAKKIPLIVDEAFLDFTTAETLLHKVKTHPNLVVLRSLTKIMAVPGLRLAYLVAAPDLVSRLWDHLGPWPLSALAIQAGNFFVDIQYGSSFDLRKKLDPLESALYPVLNQIGHPYPTQANFALLHMVPQHTDEAIDFFFQKGLLVRDCRDFNGLGLGWLRFAIRPKKEIEILDQLIKELCARAT
ncbi:MAG: aminotransferase class I/II-fold pyridoxal phosphate-dependent enzyme [Deltaproteobacteria bacterium]|jgi:threonine-phosphate decarboxylase|nr:aminotransferase class I/II-fold pyridoxal phosphate-dependent enzyme [Deltaproteobacteria bacterium]